MFFAAMATGATYLFFARSEFSWVRIGLSALVAGLAYLTRYNAIILLSLPLILVFVCPWPLDRRRRVLAALVYVTIFLAVISPWGIYCASETGQFFYNQNFHNIAYEVYVQPESDWLGFWEQGGTRDFHSFSDVFWEDPIRFIVTIAQNIPQNLISDLRISVGSHWGILSLLGLILLFLQLPSRRQLAWYLVGLCFFAILLLVWQDPRFSIFLIPFYMTLAVLALHRAVGIVPKSLRTLVVIVVLGMGIWSLGRTYLYNQFYIENERTEILTIAELYQESQDPPVRPRVMARKPHIAYYMGAEFVNMPEVEDLPALIQLLEKQQVDYLYYGVMEAYYRRKLLILLRPERHHPRLQAVASTSDPPSVLYRVERN